MGRLFLYPRARARGLSVVREAGAAQTDWASLISAEGWAYWSGAYEAVQPSPCYGC
jgi:hypothetical protein